MLKITIQPLLLLIFLLQLASSTQDSFAVFGYLPEWRYQTTNYAHVCKYTTHLILFSLEVSITGELAAIDRFPNSYLIKSIQNECAPYKTKLLICFGGNSRSSGFGSMVRNENARANFISRLVALLLKWELDGVDYNWEYPNSQEEWQGLFLLVEETRRIFSTTAKTQKMLITLDYYPDTVQEKIFASSGVLDAIDYLHMMTYDQNGKHSTREFAERSVKQGIRLRLPKHKLTLGVPFYARHTKKGEALTYQEIVASNTLIEEDSDEWGEYFFNGIATIRHKTKFALEQGLGGLMIWEVGQDIQEGELQDKSLLRTIYETIHGVQIDKDDL